MTMSYDLQKRFFKYTIYVDRKHWKDLPENNRITFGKRNDEAGVFYRQNDTIIAIDGSSKWQEWLGNFIFKRNDVGFHTDFYESALALYGIIKDKIDYTKPVWIVGYSRGGGIAQPLAKMIGDSKKCEAGLHTVTWGSPKATHKTGLVQMEGLNLTRIKSKNDPVSCLPPSFKHYDTEYIIINEIGGHQNYEKYYSKDGAKWTTLETYKDNNTKSENNNKDNNKDHNTKSEENYYDKKDESKTDDGGVTLRATYDRMIRYIIKHIEKGYVNHPNDKGGATNYGITQKLYDQWTGGGYDVKDMTIDTAYLVYYDLVATPIVYQKTTSFIDVIMVDPYIAFLVLDMAIHSGHVRSVKMLQNTLKDLLGDIATNLKVDGLLGRDTLSAIELSNSLKLPLYDTLLKNREQYFHKIVENDPTQEVFLKGWKNRLNILREFKID